MSKERYIQAKQKWAEKQRARGAAARPVASADRLPPGQKLTAGFPVLDLGVQPDIPLSEWTLTLDGLVGRPTVLTWAQLPFASQLPRSSSCYLPARATDTSWA